MLSGGAQLMSTTRGELVRNEARSAVVWQDDDLAPPVQTRIDRVGTRSHQEETRPDRGLEKMDHCSGDTAVHARELGDESRRFNEHDGREDGGCEKAEKGQHT